MVYFWKRILGEIEQLCGVGIDMDDNEIENISDSVFCEHKYNKLLQKDKNVY